MKNETLKIAESCRRLNDILSQGSTALNLAAQIQRRLAEAPVYVWPRY